MAQLRDKPSVLVVYNTAPLPDNRVKTLASWRKLSRHVDLEFAFHEGYRRRLLDRVLYRAKLATDPCGLNRRLKARQRQNRYDIVFVVKGVNIWPGTVRSLKAHGTKVVFWSNDDMWGWHNRSLWFSWAARHYDLVVTQKSYNCDPSELPSLGARVLFQNKAYDPAMHYPVTDTDRIRYRHDVVFVGTYERQRLESLLNLARSGVPVHVYGWARAMPMALYPNLTFHNMHLYGEDYAGVFSGSKICLNMLRRLSRDQQTSRSVEIPACGGFMLAERTREHEGLFAEGVEAEYYGNDEELVAKTKHYLAHDEDRRRIAAAGLARCARGGYSFDDRMAEVVNVLFESNSLPGTATCPASG